MVLLYTRAIKIYLCLKIIFCKISHYLILFLLVLIIWQNFAKFCKISHKSKTNLLNQQYYMTSQKYFSQHFAQLRIISYWFAKFIFISYRFSKFILLCEIKQPRGSGEPFYIKQVCARIVFWQKITSKICITGRSSLCVKVAQNLRV